MKENRLERTHILILIDFLRLFYSRYNTNVTGLVKGTNFTLKISVVQFGVYPFSNKFLYLLILT